MSDRPDPQARETGQVRKNVLAQVLLGMLLLVVLVTVLRWTASSREETPAPVSDMNANHAAATPAATDLPTETAPQQPTDSAPSTPPAESRFDSRVSVDTLADEQAGWLTIRAQSKGDQTSTGHGRYEPDNEFRVETSNVQSFRIDLSQLPVLKNKSFIMHIDGQNMQIAPKKQGSLTFSRTPAGSWFLEKVD